MATADSYENDNYYTRANLLQIGTTQYHSLTADDSDYVYFDVTTAGKYTIERIGTGDMLIGLFDGECDECLTANATKIERQLSAGRYYVLAFSPSDAVVDSYGLRLTSDVSTGIYADSYEGDNSRFRAKTISVGETQNHSIHTAQDEDWVKFTVASDGFYSIVTSGGDTILDLYTFENQAFGHNDDRGNGNLGSFGVTQLYANTTYYARVTSYGSKTFNYTISVQAGVIADAFESNNDNSRTTTTTTLSVGATQIHTIHSSTDVDWIKVNITTAGTYFFSVHTSERDDGQMSLGLYNSNGSELTSSSNQKKSGENPYIGGYVDAGTYYMKVSAARSGSIAGEYSVNVAKVSTLGTTSPDSYEYSPYDDISVITTSSSTTRTLNVFTDSSGNYYADVDYVKFVPTATGTYKIAISGTSAPTTMTIYTYGEDDGMLVPAGGQNGVNPFVENFMIKGQTYYIKVESDYNHLNIDSYTVSAKMTKAYDEEADTYESDNTRSAAKSISVGQTQAHSIHTVNDTDWMKFTPTTSGYYTFYTGARNGNAGDADMLLGLYDVNGKLLIYDDDSFSAQNAMLSYNMTAGQTYYLVAMAARNNMVVPYYTVSLAKGIIEDTYDIYMDERSKVDNTPSIDFSISVGQTQSHSIHTSSDVDWVSLMVDTTGYYTLQTGGSGDTIISVYDKNCNFLLLNDDSGVGHNASVTMQFQANTLYYAKVSSYQNSLIPNYTLSLTQASGGNGDAYESDNTYATAKGIIAGETQSHSIHVAGDVDWVRIRPIQTGTYQIQTSGDGDMKLGLYASNGTTLLASDDDSGIGLNARIGYVLNANTDYYIKAYTYSTSVLVDEYGLSVALMVGSELGDEYENDNTPNSAKAIILGETQSHSIHIDGDIDWVTFTPTVSAEYTIQTVGSGLNCDTQLYLYTSLANAQSGNYLQWDDDSGSDRNALISRILTAGTKYYIKARAYSTYTIPSYGLKITQNNGSGANNPINGDEYEDDSLSGLCKPIAVGREYTHSIHTQSDTDWVRFYTHQSGMYTIQTTGNGDMSFIFYRRIPGGELTTYNNGLEISSGGASNNACYRTYLEKDNWYYVRITTAGRQTTANNYGIRVDIDSSSVQGDSYETAGGKISDNVASRATWLTANSSQVHSIHTPGDEDWFVLKSTAAAKYILALSQIGLYLYQYKKNANGTLAYIGRSEAKGVDNNAFISVDANSTYYFKVVATSTTSTVASYSINLSLPMDRYEDDDTSAKASTLTFGTSQSHSLHTSLDVDWVKFTVNSTGNYQIQNDSDGTVAMVLYKNNGSSNVEVGRSTGTKVYNNLAAGTYYVRMTSANNAACDGYAINVSRYNTIKADSYENDNTRNSAKSISLSSSQTHSLHTTSDVDYVKFYATAGNKYTVSIVGENLNLTIENSSGSSLKSTTGNNISAYFTPTSSGYYYAKINSSNSMECEKYTVKVEQENPQENYVILYNGGGDKANNHSQYFYGLKKTYQVLVNQVGIKPENIYIVSADGLSSNQDLSIIYTKGSYAYKTYTSSNYSFATSLGTQVLSATTSNLSKVFTSIGEKMDSNDHFLFWATDHGSDYLNSSHNYYTQGNEVICGWDGNNITGSQFNQLANKLTNGYQSFIFGTCFSGGILNALDTSSTSTRQRWGTAVASQGEFGWGAIGAATTEYDSDLNGYIWTKSYGYCETFTQGLASNVNTTQSMAQYLRNNAPYLCANSYSNNGVCSEHYGRDYYGLVYGNATWKESEKCSHAWSKGSSFNIFATSASSNALSYMQDDMESSIKADLLSGIDFSNAEILTDSTVASEEFHYEDICDYHEYCGCSCSSCNSITDYDDEHKTAIGCLAGTLA